MHVVEYEEALRGLNEAVKTKGYDYIYPRRERLYCYNVWQGQPDCIVGWVMVWLGVPVEWFEEEHRDTDDVGDTCKALHLEGRFEFTEEARDLLGKVQISQDNGMAWGEAVTRAHLGDEWFASLNLHADVA